MQRTVSSPEMGTTDERAPLQKAAVFSWARREGHVPNPLQKKNMIFCLVCCTTTPNRTLSLASDQWLHHHKYIYKFEFGNMYVLRRAKRKKFLTKVNHFIHHENAVFY